MSQRGATVLELMVVGAILLALAAAFAVPGYRSYAGSRAARDAAARLTEDLAFLARTAGDGTTNEGACLIIVSAQPLTYRGYAGRPSTVDPASHLGPLLVERTFSNVALQPGPIDAGTPLLFATNGSAQYESAGVIASQHQTIEFVLVPLDGGHEARVDVSLFTGGVSGGT